MTSREELRAKAEDAVVSIKKALVRLATFLEQDYLPATRPTCGVHGWREGKRLYEQCLRYHTSTNMTPHQVHDLGLQEISRIEANMKAVSDYVNNNNDRRMAGSFVELGSCNVM